MESYRHLSYDEKKYIEQFHVYNMLPSISLPTRVTSSTATIIDNLWTNCIDGKSGVIVSSVSDHFMSILIVKNRMLKSESCKVEYRQHSHCKIDLFVSRVKKFCSDFSRFVDLDVDLKTKIFCDNVYAIYNSTFVLRSKTLSSKQIKNPWMTPALIAAVKQKHNLYRQLCKGYGSLVYFRRYRNVLTALLRTAKKNYCRAFFNKYIGDF